MFISDHDDEKVGSTSSSMPIPIPVGSEMNTSVRTPGEASAPSRPLLRACSGSTWRVGSSAVKIAVPVMTANAETISAPAGEVSAAINAVSSGPLMKISSIIVESSA